MKKNILISFVTIYLLGSCDVLDVKPYHSIPAEDAITNAAQVESAIMGCYDALQSGSYYGLNYLIFGDLSADNLNHAGITVTWAEFDNNNILADNGLVEGTWASIYVLLNRVNNVIDKIPGIAPDKISENDKTLALAELRFLRALGHYDLMRLFGPVPIRNMAVTNDEVSLNPPRNTIDEVMEFINYDLDFAIENISATIVRGRAGKTAAQALKARVALHRYYLTQNTVYLNQAIDYSTEVINNPSLGLEPDYAKLYSLEPTIESVFEVTFNEQDRNLIARYFAPTSLAGRYEFSPTDTYLNSFEKDDIRKQVSMATAGTTTYVDKYNDIAAGSDPVYIFRLAEMYLIRAEAAALLQLNTNDILNDINLIRERAGLQPANITSYTGLLLEIESQRQKEFAFEGHRWFDLIRAGRAIDVLEKVININQTLYPIPQAEIIANDNPGMYQNDGY